MHKAIQSKTNKLLYILPVFAVIIISVLYMASFATQNTETTHAESGGSDLTFTAANSLEISIPSSQNISITPNSEGSFTSGSITVGVGTNNPYGYKLTMTTTTTDLTRTVPLSDGSTPTIPTLASNGSGYTEETFTTNTWGYKLSTDTNYYPVTSVMPVASTTSTTGGSLSTSTVDFATKLDNTKPSGTYGIILTFVATIKDLPTSTTFNNAFDFAGKDTVYKDGQRYYKMQDMSGFICSMVATPTDTTSAESTQLIDTRDNKIYWVSKLKDGNCWMTQNLDLDLNSTVALTSDTTDLHSVTSWTPVRSTIDSTSYGNITTCSSQSDDGTGCWGKTNRNFAPNFSSDNTTTDMTVNANNSPYSVNPGYRYMTFTDRTTENDYWYSNGDTFANCSTQDTNCGGQGHYMIGNYYNFAAATATNNVQTTAGGSANVVENKVMPDSICPKGWRMPIDQTTNNEYSTLLAAYNITGTGALEFNFQGLNKVRRDPLYFVRSGVVYGGTLYDAGTGSDVWSSTISSSTSGYNLDFNGTGINPASSNSRVDGFAVRCLARTDLTIEDAVYMQDVTPEMRQNTAIGTTTTLKDKRDNNEYTIGKLEDGNIWLLDNLRLGAVALAEPLSTNNTNMSPSVNFTLPASSTDKFSDDTAGWTTPGINTSKSGTMSTNGVYQGDIGVFYNYCAASAGTICAPKGDNTSSASYDICPASWRMPTGGESGECQALYTAYNSDDTNFQTALHTPLSGYFGGGSAHEQNGNGYFWSSTRSDGNKMYDLHVGTSRVFPRNESYRRDGSSVRCVLK